MRYSQLHISRRINPVLVPVLRLASKVSFRSISDSVSPTKYITDFIPLIQQKSRIIIPISLGRYVPSEKKKNEYDDMLASLFCHMANLLQSGWVTGVDVVSTGGLQRINWEEDLVNKVESHFLSKHGDLLGKQLSCYKWDEWIESQGSDTFEKNYQEIDRKSHKGTEWYDLMEKTHESVNMSQKLEDSLEYQRREYAAIMLMKDYDHIVYTGHISPAWSYMYHILRDATLPTFTRADFKKNGKGSSIVGLADANHTVKMIIAMIEQTLSDDNFPKKEKEKIIVMARSLFYAYAPKEDEVFHSVHPNGFSSPSLMENQDSFARLHP